MYDIYRKNKIYAHKNRELRRREADGIKCLGISL